MLCGEDTTEHGNFRSIYHIYHTYHTDVGEFMRLYTRTTRSGML